MSGRQWRKKFRTSLDNHFFGSTLFSLFFAAVLAKTLVIMFEFYEQKCREQRTTFPGTVRKKKEGGADILESEEQ